MNYANPSMGGHRFASRFKPDRLPPSIQKTWVDVGIDLKDRTGVEVKTTCPQCSPHRKKKNYPCLNVNTEKNIWYCHHCGWSGSLKSGEWSRPEIRKTYVKPTFIRAKKTDDVTEWFASRGIPESVIERNQITKGSAYFPQVEEERPCILFPFLRGGEVINIKYRTRDKLFRMAAGAERILYGIDDIAETLAIVEGEVDKLSLEVAGFLSCVSVPDGAPAPNTKNYSSKFDFLQEPALAQVKTFVIAVDADESGVRLQQELIRLLGRDKCLVVTWPSGYKDANAVLTKYGADAVRECIEAAQAPRIADWPEPEALCASYAPLPYPTEALPPIMRAAVEEVIEFVKAPEALAASSALSAVSVVLQGFYDVQRAPGLKGPCSLYLLSIAESGERKTSCDSYFKQEIESWQRERAEGLKPSIADYEANKAAWEATKSGILDAIKKAAKEGKPVETYERELRKVERKKPAPVRVPRLIRGDDTPENLGWSLMREWPSAGVLSSEAGVVFGSHGMGSDSITRNLALLNVLWDGGSIPVGRRSSESYTIEGARLSMGLQVQEVTLRSFFDKSKGLARGTGFLARFIMAWPQSTMGTRFYTDAPDWSRLHAFNQRIRQLLESELSLDDDGRLKPVTLTLSEQAHAAWVTFLDAVEAQLSPEGDLQDVKDVASKVADNAARLACLFHVFENGAGAISADAMACGAKLAAWHLAEARRFLAQFSLPVEWMNAGRLDQWLVRYCKVHAVTSVATKTALQRGPLRDKATLDAAATYLGEHGRMRIVTEGKKRLIYVNPMLLR